MKAIIAKDNNFNTIGLEVKSKDNKNTILFIAHTTGMFKNALIGIDTKKVERKYYKEYIAARIADGTL